MPLFRKARKIVLAQFEIHEMTLCCNEGMGQLRLGARVVPLGRESGVVGKAATALGFSEPRFSDL